MLIERIGKKLLDNIYPDGFGEIFYIPESDVNFFQNNDRFSGKKFSEVPLPQWIPYDRFLLHFDNSIVSYMYQKCKCNCGHVGLLVDYFTCTKSGAIGPITPNGDLVIYWFDESLRLVSFQNVDRHNGQQSQISIDYSVAKPTPPIEYSLYYYLLYNFLSFLTCKNIKTEFIEPTKKQQRNRRKNNKPPKISYHMLMLKDIAKRNNGNECSDSQGLWSNRIHFCRGHIREYTTEKPLFGKYSGKFWVPPHARGNSDFGVARKDYKLCV